MCLLVCVSVHNNISLEVVAAGEVQLVFIGLYTSSNRYACIHTSISGFFADDELHAYVGGGVVVVVVTTIIYTQVKSSKK